MLMNQILALFGVPFEDNFGHFWGTILAANSPSRLKKKSKKGSGFNNCVHIHDMAYNFIGRPELLEKERTNVLTLLRVRLQFQTV